jgi:hypothetical protein
MLFDFINVFLGHNNRKGSEIGYAKIMEIKPASFPPAPIRRIGSDPRSKHMDRKGVRNF